MVDSQGGAHAHGRQDYPGPAQALRRDRLGPAEPQYGSCRRVVPGRAAACCRAAYFETGKFLVSGLVAGVLLTFPRLIAQCETYLRLAKESLAQEEIDGQQDLDNINLDGSDDKTYAAMGICKTIYTVSLAAFFTCDAC